MKSTFPSNGDEDDQSDTKNHDKTSRSSKPISPTSSGSALEYKVIPGVDSLPTTLDEFLIRILREKTLNDLKISTFLAGITVEEQLVASEIAHAISNNEYDIADKLTLSRIHSKTLESLVKKTRNPKLVLKIAAYLNSTSVNQELFDLMFKDQSSFINISILMSKQYLVPRPRFAQLVRELQICSQFKKASVPVRILAIAYLAENQVDVTKNISSLDLITKEFNEQNDEYQRKVIKKLRLGEIQFLYQFLTHIDSERLRVELVKELREQITPLELVMYFQWKNPDPNFSGSGIFLRIVRPACEKIISYSRNLEDLLTIWPYITDPRNDFKLDKIRLKFRELIAKPGYLQESFRDPAMPVLQDKFFAVQNEVIYGNGLIESLRAKLEAESKIVLDLTGELNDLRAKRVESGREKSLGQEAVVRQIKVDQLRSLIPLFDILSKDLESGAPEALLESLGIEIIGRVGSKLRWDPRYSESLTGQELTAGIVVRIGYTWFTGKEVVPLRRVLIKSE